MKSFTKFTLFAAVLLLGSYGISAQIGVGIRIGLPPAPRVLSHVPRLAPTLSGLTAIGIPRTDITAGTKVIGLALRIPAPAGLVHAARADSISTATGKATVIATMPGIADTRINTTIITEVQIQFATHRPRHQ